MTSEERKRFTVITNKNFENETGFKEKHKSYQTNPLTEKLMKLIDHSEMLTAFDEEQFTEYVDKIVIADRKTAVFYLKCGLKLKEELQCMATE